MGLAGARLTAGGGRVAGIDLRAHRGVDHRNGRAEVRALQRFCGRHGVLSGSWRDAVKSRRLATNPAKGVDNLPRKTARRHIYLSADDVHPTGRRFRPAPRACAGAGLLRACGGGRRSPACA